MTPGWWIVEEDVEGNKLRSVANVKDNGLASHPDFSVDHPPEEMQEKYGLKFIRLLDLFEEAERR